jgi:hypothetical protein
VVLRRHRRVRSLFGSQYNYFPVYRTTPQAFFRDSTIEQKLYSLGDDLVRLLSQMSEQSLESTRQEDWTLPQILTQALTLGYTAEELLLNSRGQVHTISFRSRASRYLYIPVGYQYPVGEWSTRVGLPDRHRAIPLAELERFLTAWNRRTPTWKPQRLLVHISSAGKMSTIGIRAGGLYFYCEPVATTSGASRAFPEITPQYLWYLPERINQAVESIEGNIPDPGGLRRRADEQRVEYRKSVRRVMSSLDRDRNPAMRQRVEQALRGNRNLHIRLQDLGLSPGDLERLRAAGFVLSSTQSYEFDSVRLQKIRGMRDRSSVYRYLRSQFPEESTLSLELLATDFCHPMCREYLLRGILLEDLGLGEIQYWADEEVYILQ